MRAAMLVLVSACALAACNPAAPGGGGASSVFPNLNSGAYRLEANVISEQGNLPVVMIRDGQKARFEITTPAGVQTMITDASTGEAISLTNMGGQTIALRMNADQFENPTRQWESEYATTATLVGPCSGAGETGSEWSNTADGHTNTVCVTSDGVILSTAQDGQPMWQTTRVQRGAQDPSLFTVPAGVQVTDMGDVSAAMQQMLERAKAAAGQ